MKKNTGGNKENNNNGNHRDRSAVHLQSGAGFIHDIHEDLHEAQRDTRVAKTESMGCGGPP